MLTKQSTTMKARAYVNKRPYYEINGIPEGAVYNSDVVSYGC